MQVAMSNASGVNVLQAHGNFEGKLGFCRTICVFVRFLVVGVEVRLHVTALVYFHGDAHRIFSRAASVIDNCVCLNDILAARVLE